MVPSRGSRDFNTTLIAVLNILLFLLRPRLANSAREPAGTATGAGEDALKATTPQLTSHMRTHGLLLWSSVGLLMPAGVLLIRMSARVQCGKSMKLLFYSHVLLQIASVILATVGAVHAAKNFENAFSNSHQRMGLALFALLCLQPFTGIFRPHRGAKGRTLWFFVHWFMGTGLCVLAIVTIYFGLHAYQVKTQRSTKIWTVLFTAEVSAIAFVYLLQDRWDYMQKQGRVQLRDHEQITSAEHHQLQVVVEAVKNVISNPIENPSCLIGF